MPQERIREYILEGMIGRGGMGSVYLARHVHLGTKAALKVLLEQYSDNPSIKERFVNEARLLHELRHPNIVEQREFFEEHGRLVLVMEYVDGRGLDRMIGQEVGPIPWEKALPLFVQILDGIGYAHSKGVIHRDIKPSNILVSREGRVKITDLGIAKIAGQKGLTRTGAQMGTLYYESPEQIRGAKEVDQRSDIFSLGMTLYEMLAGRLPFETEGDTSEFQVMNTIVNRGEHFDPRQYYPHIPEWLVKTVQKATHLDPEKRFQSCEGFRQVIEKYGKVTASESGYWAEKAASVAVTPVQITQPVSGAAVSAASGEGQCPGCGAIVERVMRYCRECGEPLEKTCPDCRALIRWYCGYCPKCGCDTRSKSIAIESRSIPGADELDQGILSAYLDISAVIKDPDVDERGVLGRFTDQLNAILSSKGVTVQWIEQKSHARMVLQIHCLSSGNRALRYLVGFGAGSVSFSGKIMVNDGTAWHTMPFEERKGTGMAGGEGIVLLLKVAQKAAQKVAQFALSHSGIARTS